MDLLTTTYSLSAAEAAQKMGHLIALRAAVAKAREPAEWVQRKNGHWHLKFDHASARELQLREQELAEFVATMRPRLVQ